MASAQNNTMSLFESLIDRASWGVLVFDAQTEQCTYVNQRAAELLQTSPDELTDDRDIREILAYGHRELLPDPGDEVSMGVYVRGRRRQATLRRESLPAELASRYLVFSLLRIDIPQDMPEHVAGESGDLPEHASYREVFESAACGLCILDKQGLMLETNAEFRRFLGLSTAQLQGRPWTDWVHRDDIETCLRYARERFRDPRHLPEGLEMRLASQYGFQRWMKLFVSTLPGTSRAIISCLDMSQQKQNESLLKSMTRHLEDLVEQEVDRRIQAEKQKHENEQMLIQQSKMAAMGQMIGAIAHQWKQPLNILGLWMQSVEDEYRYGDLNDAYMQEAVANVMQQLDFMASTIDDFRNFFKPSKRIEAFEVLGAIEDIVRLLQVQFREHIIRVQLPEGAEAHQLRVQGYPNEFKQVILNFLTNARDAIVGHRADEELEDGRYPEGLIDVRLEAVGESVQIDIEDNGGGISEPLIDRLFEPYFTTKGDKGDGIGLYLARTIVEDNMKGQLSVFNATEGACFRIALPSASASEQGHLQEF